MAIVIPLDVSLSLGGGSWIPSTTDLWVRGDGTTPLPGAVYTGSGFILPNGWTKAVAVYVARTTPGIPPAGPTTDWYQVFDIRTPVNTPVIASVTRSDTSGSNILAPFYAVVDWSGSPGSDPVDQMSVSWFQNGAFISSTAVAAGANSAQSPIIYYHGDTYEVQLQYYNPGNGHAGPVASSGGLTY